MHDEQLPFPAPVHVRHWEAHGRHSRVATSPYVPTGVTGHDATQVVPDKKPPATHAVHCPVLAPVQAAHSAAHDLHPRLAVSPYDSRGQVAKHTPLRRKNGETQDRHAPLLAPVQVAQWLMHGLQEFVAVSGKWPEGHPEAGTQAPVRGTR
jgi:hypothetical protein